MELFLGQRDDLSSVLFPFMSLADLEAFETTGRSVLRMVRENAPYQAMYGVDDATCFSRGISSRRERSRDWWRRRLRRRRATSGIKLGGRSWEQLPVAVGGAALATFEDDSVYLCGGATYGYALEGRAWLWVGGEWHLQRSRPGAARWQHTAVSVGSAIFVHGGEVDSSDRFSVDSTVYCVRRTRFRSTSCQVFAQPQPQYRSAGHSCHADVDRERLLFLFGRVDEYLCTSTVRSFSYARKMWNTLECAGTSPCPRWCHGAAATTKGSCNTKRESIVVFGGWDMKQNLFLNDVHVLEVDHTATLTWSTLVLSTNPVVSAVAAAAGLNYVPTPRCQAPCVVLDDEDEDGGFLLVFGGAASSTTNEDDRPVRDLDDAALFDLATCQWQPLECDRSLKALRGGCNAVVSHRGKRLICGGIHNVDEETPVLAGGFPEFLDQCLELRAVPRRLDDARRKYDVSQNLLSGIPVATDGRSFLNNHRVEEEPTLLASGRVTSASRERDDDEDDEARNSGSLSVPQQEQQGWQAVAQDTEENDPFDREHPGGVERRRLSTASRVANAVFSHVFL